MKSIKVTKWKAKMPSGEEIEDSLLTVLSTLISNKKPEELPKGLDNFRLFHRLSEAFRNAEKSNTLELEDADYSFLKKTIENDIPSIWGMNKDIMEAVDNFLNAK